MYVCMYTGSDSTVESTGITTHLIEMADILCQEEEKKNPNDPGTMVCYRTHTHTHTHSYVCTHTHTHTQYVRTHMHIHTHICTGPLYGVCFEAQDS